jgi:FPC/CPF motif-containing protein YcgG
VDLALGWCEDMEAQLDKKKFGFAFAGRGKMVCWLCGLLQRHGARALCFWMSDIWDDR